MRQRLGENIGWIFNTGNKFKSDESGSNSLATTMIRQRIPTFPQRRMRDSRAVDNRLVVPKQPRGTIQRDPKHAQSVSKINDLLDSSASGHKLRPISGRFNLVLTFSEPISWSLIQHMQNPSARASRDNIVHQICVFKGGRADLLSLGWRHMIWELLFGTTVHRFHPAITLWLLAKHFFMFRNLCTKPDAPMRKLSNISTNTF
mmetsp:Transcript_20329/g.42625  ORF Transcript_20329/g.42625 Transcript_20329/m.42625 type:complete len:203 (+) Transcript_20329:236-844(+)